jgi:hypothetical protein
VSAAAPLAPSTRPRFAPRPGGQRGQHRARGSRRVCCRAAGVLYRARASAAGALVGSTGPRLGCCPGNRPPRPRAAAASWRAPSARAWTAPLVGSTAPKLRLPRPGALHRPERRALAVALRRDARRWPEARLPRPGGFHRAADAPHGPELRLPRPGCRCAVMLAAGPRLGCRAAGALHGPELRLPRRWRPPRARASAAAPLVEPPRPGALHRPERRALAATAPLTPAAGPRFAPHPGGQHRARASRRALVRLPPLMVALPRPRLGCRCAGALHCARVATIGPRIAPRPVRRVRASAAGALALPPCRRFAPCPGGHCRAGGSRRGCRSTGPGNGAAFWRCPRGLAGVPGALHPCRRFAPWLPLCPRFAPRCGASATPELEPYRGAIHGP